MNSDVDTNIRLVSTVTAFKEVDGVVRPVASSNVQCKRSIIHAVQTPVDQHFACGSIEAEQITAGCNIQHKQQHQSFVMLSSNVSVMSY